MKKPEPRHQAIPVPYQTVFLWMILIVFFVSCAAKQDKVERYIENGVEVVVNHLKPYKTKGEPSNLSFEKEFTIDLERDDIAELGLSDIWSFDVDSKGNIYFLNIKSGDNLIFKFDEHGKYVTSFVRPGQGPGEIGSTWYLTINSRDQILTSDTEKNKFLIFSNDGKLLKEVPAGSIFGSAQSLDNGGYLVMRQEEDPDAASMHNRVLLCDSEFQEIKELDRFTFPHPIFAKTIRGTHSVFECTASKGRIYLGNEERGYEIRVLDQDGNLVRKIKKEFKPVQVSEEFKKRRMKPYEKPKTALIAAQGKKIYFPKCMPPFHGFFPDDEGRLFVMTYEKGENPGEYIYDIFNSAGLFIGRKALRILGDTGALHARSKRQRLYSLRRKENDYKELVVYKMRWE